MVLKQSTLAASSCETWYMVALSEWQSWRRNGFTLFWGKGMRCAVYTLLYSVWAMMIRVKKLKEE